MRNAAILTVFLLSGCASDAFKYDPNNLPKPPRGFESRFNPCIDMDGVSCPGYADQDTEKVLRELRRISRR